jgi:hypothetical protein
MVYPLESLENFSHYFDPDFMGMEFATEFVQAIYESAMLNQSHQDETCDYLQKDLIFNTQCVPGLHVDKLEFCLSLGPFDKETGIRTFRSHEGLVKRDYIDAMRELEVVRMLPRRPKSHIEIWALDTSDMATGRLEEGLFPLLFDMKGEGFNVYMDGYFPPSDEDGKALTRADWEKKIKTQSAIVSVLKTHRRLDSTSLTASKPTTEPTRVTRHKARGPTTVSTTAKPKMITRPEWIGVDIVYTGVRRSIAGSHQAHLYGDSIRDEEHARSYTQTYLQHARYPK